MSQTGAPQMQKLLGMYPGVSLVQYAIYYRGGGYNINFCLMCILRYEDAFYVSFEYIIPMKL